VLVVYRALLIVSRGCTHSSCSLVVFRVRAEARLVSVPLDAMPQAFITGCCPLLERVLYYTARVVVIIKILQALSVLKFRLLKNLRRNIYVIEILEKIGLLTVIIIRYCYMLIANVASFQFFWCCLFFQVMHFW
jgi:hypothetical protein